MLWMRAEAGVMNSAHARMSFEKCSDARGIFAMTSHPAGQGLHPAMDQPTIEWGRNRTANCLHLADSLKEFALLASDHSTAKDIAVAPKIFRGRMHDEIGAEIEWALDKRRPGVVAGEKSASPVRDFSRGHEV